MKKISIIIPIYNEEKTILEVLKKISRINLGINKEIIIINDGSTDNSKLIIKQFLQKTKNHAGLIYKFKSKINQGKGSAIREGLSLCTGDIITIQDADLEYNPEDIKKLIKPILKGSEKVIYGSRFLKKHKPLYKIYFMGNKLLTLITSVLYRSKITDMETCYKVFSSDVIMNIKLNSKGFDFEPEITSKILKRRIKIKEIPISYIPRKTEDGKKINWKDGIKAIIALFYYKIFKD